MSITKKNLKEIEERLNNTQMYKDGGNNLVIGIDDGEFQFTKDDDAKFFVYAGVDIAGLLNEVKELKYKLNQVTGSKEEEISKLKFQLKRHIEVEENRREEFKRIHSLLEDYEIPKGDKRGSYGPVTRFQLLIERVSDCITVQEEDKEERQGKLLIIFNKLLKIFSLKYDDLNKRFLVEGDQADELYKLEAQFEELGLSEHPDSDKQGVSILSLFATITDIFCNKRLAFNLDDNKNLIGVTYYFYNDRGEWVEDTLLNRVPSCISDHKFEDKK